MFSVPPEKQDSLTIQHEMELHQQTTSYLNEKFFSQVFKQHSTNTYEIHLLMFCVANKSETNLFQLRTAIFNKDTYDEHMWWWKTRTWCCLLVARKTYWFGLMAHLPTTALHWRTVVDLSRNSVNWLKIFASLNHWTLIKKGSLHNFHLCSFTKRFTFCCNENERTVLSDWNNDKVDNLLQRYKLHNAK